MNWKHALAALLLGSCLVVSPVQAQQNARKGKPVGQYITLVVGLGIATFLICRSSRRS